ncbi:nuclear transport factor 2 family protein [Streptomyces sp. NBC_01136]|uniref:nuclear transport factor 2 family protein n=1 Tax=unclassified Streptomyces TaxID=2593676 RepID=UPI003246A6D7|nr:nuclear transport factor 2 family protein [Streptomyces sp. NBC_01136]
MDTRDVITRYYELASQGDWASFVDLFAVDMVLDEQLAGHVEGRQTLSEMLAGFPDLYASFTNAPRHVVVDGEQAAVVSHISATTHTGDAIEADVANYFRVVGGRITYLANFHDTVPFRAVVPG